MSDSYQWALSQMQQMLPLSDDELRQILVYADSLEQRQATSHLENLLGDSTQSKEFIASYKKHREAQRDQRPNYAGGADQKSSKNAPPAYGSSAAPNGARSIPHTNCFIEAARIRARDEQEMQQTLQALQYKYGIYNSEIEPEHDTDWPCGCPIHNYQRMKLNRLPVLDQWSRAVMYKGDKPYNDLPLAPLMFSSNPYRNSFLSPYGYMGQAQTSYLVGMSRQPIPKYHAQWIMQTIKINNSLNQQAQCKADDNEPKGSIWEDKDLPAQMNGLSLDSKGASSNNATANGTKAKRLSKFATFKKAVGIESSEDRFEGKAARLRAEILAEEQGRWPSEHCRHIVRVYQEKVGMFNKISEMRARTPIQYLHLLRAGYFEPIPVAWAYQASNPMKFSIEAAAGWRGITPAWRGYEDLAEERLYWVLNHREGTAGPRMKPDFISAMNMALQRMAQAVEPPPLYFSETDTCMTQHTAAAYSKQVMPPPFHAYDRPEKPVDETMILLDVSGSMDFEPTRPLYNEYLITGFTRTYQPKNKDVARAIIRRFTDAMANHSHQSSGYELVTFANQPNHIGRINSQNFNQSWQKIHFGGGTRVMTGWQRVKELHFQKHAESATHHPEFGWQPGPQTPMLRLLLVLDGEATDMDEFELDLLGLSFAHVTIFLVGAEDCPHHHRHANELQRISDVNHHVSFVDAQGNVPERFVTHELLKRHLGYDMSMQEFQTIEELPAYSEYAG
ncbi:hypothetical protein NLU13_0501 [Sarocladium strictum]|uniref:VWFA domain-containing protein n=1 Tax=Sarocladium strictum TaxID=5046 RepID=A0AA39GR21_SARSR|nr:hypothetical protein NLU13_0501 [Sarocladium strictum]